MAKHIDKTETRRVIATFVASHALFYGAMVTPFLVAAYATEFLPVTLVGSAIALVGSFLWMRAGSRAVSNASKPSRAQSDQEGSPRHDPARAG